MEPTKIGTDQYRMELRGLRAEALSALLDELLFRYLRARNPIEGHFTNLYTLLRFHAEWMVIQDRIDTVIDELLRRAEDAHTPAAVERIVRDFHERNPDYPAREETLPW